MSSVGVMTGMPHSVTPLTLHLTTAKLNPRLPQGYHARHQQQLQYEPESAKTFFYRSELHLQNSLPSNALPHIRSKSSNINKGKYHGLSTVEEIATGFKAALPKLDTCLPNQHNLSQEDSRSLARNAESFYDEICMSRDLPSQVSLSPEQEPLETIPASSDIYEPNYNMNNQPEERVPSPTSHDKISSAMKTSKKKHRKKKSKGRKSEGRKSKIFNHRLKSPRKTSFIDTDQDRHLTANHSIKSTVCYNRSESEPLGLQGAQVKPIVVVQRESVKKPSSQRLYHSAGKSSQSHNSPRLQPRSKTHLALSPARLAPTKITFSHVLPSPRMSWMSNNLFAQGSPVRHSQDFSALNSQISPAPSPRVSQEVQNKLTKVYLSEQQSGKRKELGVELPCAPPATPASEMYEIYEYIPSMADIRAQRAVKMRLDILERQERKVQEKVQEAKLKRDKREEKEKEKAKKRRQRREIYALNKIMTELEHANFREFCKAKGINPKI